MANTSNKSFAAKPDPAVDDDSDLDIPELPPGAFKNAVVGKYYFEMMQGSNVVRVHPDLLEDFPNEKAVNDALRLVKQLRSLLTPPREQPKSKRKTA